MADNFTNIAIVPAIISDNLKDLNDKLTKTVSFSSEVQIDFFDEVYVPHYRSVSPGVFQSFHTYVDLIAHILAFEPENYIDDLKAAGFKRVLFHLETTDKADDIVEKARKSGLEIGIGINPDLNPSDLDRFKGKVSEYLFLAVDPKHPGVFRPEILDKIVAFRKDNPEVRISIDGAVSIDNIEDIYRAGVDIAYVGGAIYDHGQPKDNFEKLLKRLRTLKAS